MSCENNSLSPCVPCGQLDGQFKYLYLLEDGVGFTTQTQAKTLSEWQGLIQGEDAIVFPPLFSTESQDSGAAYDSSPLGDIVVSNGTVSFMFNIAANTELYKRIASYSGRTDMTLVIGTAKGALKMYKTTDGEYKGFDIQLFNVENPTLNDGSVAEKAPVKITLADTDQYRNNAVVFKPSFSLTKLKCLKDVILTIVGTPTATNIQFTANLFSDNEDVQAANPVYGLADGDFKLVDATGAAQTIDSIGGGTAALGGVYTATGTAFVTGLLGLEDPETMPSTGYKGAIQTEVTI